MRVATLASLLAAALPLAAQTAFRDPLVQAFCGRQRSEHAHRSGSQYVAINMSGTPGNERWAPMPQIDDDYIVFTANAPLTAINYSDAAWTGRDRCPATGGLLVQVPIPTSLVVPNTLATTGRHSSCPRQNHHPDPAFTRCVAGGPATSVIRSLSVDIYGDGRWASRRVVAIHGRRNHPHRRISPGRTDQHAIRSTSTRP